MEMCWSAEPSQRPLLGYVQPQLQKIQARALQNFSPGKLTCTYSMYNEYSYNNCDLLPFREY